MAKPAGFNATSLAESNSTSYPAPFRDDVRGRWYRRLGDHAGLKNFGVNLVRIEPGGMSSQRHWHTREDEFVYVLEGEIALVTDAGEQRLTPGMCAGFPAGAADGHHFLNRSDKDALMLVVGDRQAADECHYPDVDLFLGPGADGTHRFMRKNGEPY